MQRVACRIRDAKQAGNQLVVVVSAMGDTTDDLIALAKQINPRPADREMDMLMSTGEVISSSILTMALHALGEEAVSLTGPQAGIYTDEIHTKAKIRDIRPDLIRHHLDRGCVVIVAGFQGLTPAGEIATLGRGGSDTTAVALAAAIQADRCQIFTDVDGVYTTDPRMVKEARKLDVIAYDEMLELASLGAKVLQSRSVEFAKKYNVELEVLSSFTGNPGTVVTGEVKEMEDIFVRGVAADINQAKVTLQAVPDQPGIAARIFKQLAAEAINVDMIVQNVSEQGSTDLSFTVPEDDLVRVRGCVDKLCIDVGARGATYDDKIAKVSIVGVGMRSHSGIAFKMFDALAQNDINIEMISTSEIKISVVIERSRARDAVRILHESFELQGAPA